MKVNISEKLYEFAGDESHRGLQTGPEIVRQLTQAQRVWTLTKSGETWSLDKNNGNPAGVVVGSLGMEDFGKVRALSFYVDATTIFAKVEYNTPCTRRVVDYLACGSLHSIWAIKLYLGANTTATSISIYG